MFLGSWAIDDLLTFPANTHTAATGAATDADAVPDYRVYENETGTPILTGTMALLDSANTVGFYSEQITLSAANGFEQGKSYTIYVTATVATVVGTMSHSFQILAEVNVKTWNDLVTVELPLVPTTAGRKLDVSANGEAGLDWGNIGNPTTAQNLSATNIDTDQVVASVTGAVGSVTAIVTANVTELDGGAQSLTDLKDFADDGYDPATNKVQGVVLVDTLTTYTGNTPQTGDSFARIGVAGAGLTNIDLPNQTFDLVGNITGNLSGSVGSVTGAVGSVTGAVGSVTGNLGGNVNGNVVGSVGSVVGAVGSVTGAVGSVTGNVGGNVTGSAGSVVGAVGSVTGNVGGNVTGSVGSLAAQAKLDVNAEVVDGLSVDTYAEPAAVPAATASLAAKLGWFTALSRNKRLTTATLDTLRNDADAGNIATATLSDDGVTFTRTEYS